MSNTHCAQHDFVVDKDGQVTCSICGVMDDEMPQNEDQYLVEHEEKLPVEDPYAGVGDVKDFE
jgi:uncharacterized Zn finger protein (UPF0148 family)